MNTFVTCIGSRTALTLVIGQAVARSLDIPNGSGQVVGEWEAKKQVAVVMQVARSEREQALTIRAAWMRRMGLSQAEIDEACSDPNEPVDLEEEIRNLQAAERLPQITPPSSVLRKWATWV